MRTSMEQLLFADDPTDAADSRRHQSSLVLRPEEEMMKAILEIAFTDYYWSHESDEARRVRREAEAWIWSDEAEWPWSFVNICEYFHLSPGRVRAALRARR